MCFLHRSFEVHSDAPVVSLKCMIILLSQGYPFEHGCFRSLMMMMMVCALFVQYESPGTAELGRVRLR